MLATRDPNEAYSRSAFDARVQGGDTATLVHLCLEQAIAGLGSALLANERGEPAARSKALTRALTAITALEIGVDHSAPLASALLTFYGNMRRAVLDAATNFDPGKLAAVRQDVIDIRAAMARDS